MKLAKRPQAYRIRRIIELIRSGVSSQSLPSANDLASELEVSWRTIIRDLEYLRDDEGAPILYDASKKGYYLSDSGWSLKPVTLNQREVFAFSVASRLLQPFRGTPLEMDLDTLFSKIARSLEGTVTLSVDALTDHISVISDDYVPLDLDIWVKVAGVIDRREVIRIRYRKFSGEIKSYQVFPIHLAAYHGNWYLIAFDGKKDLPLTFALSRIRAIFPTGKTRDLPEGFDLNEYLKSDFGIARGGQEFQVRLLFSKNVATYIAERQWHPSQKLIRRRGGAVELRMQTRGWKELVRWILSWQPEVRVLAPRSLRDRVNSKMRLGLATQRG